MILISYPNITCYNRLSDTHNYSYTHHTHKRVSLKHMRHSDYETLCAQHLNMKQRIVTIATAHRHYFHKQHQSICFYAANWIVI